MFQATYYFDKSKKVINYFLNGTQVIIKWVFDIFLRHEYYSIPTIAYK